MLVIEQPKTDFKSLFLRYSRSPQGIYLMEGFSTNVGVLPYVIEVDGTSQAAGILTSDTELFHPKSLASINGIAVVKEHPKNFNAQTSDMGGIVLSATPSYDNEDYSLPTNEMTLGLLLKVAVWSEELLDYISAGNSELSAGYIADIIEQEGTWHGSPYSYSKTNILYDHLAVVEKGSARNGSKSKLLSDSHETRFQILSNRTKKLTDSVTVINPISATIKTDTTTEPKTITETSTDPSAEEKNNDFYQSNADITKSPDIIENDCDLPSTNKDDTPMKNLVLPDGKMIALTDDVHGIISDALDSLVREKQALENTASQTKKEADIAKFQFEDSKTKTEELNKKIEQDANNLSKSVAIASKAERLGITIDYTNFDLSKTMREALKDKYPDVDTVGEDTLYYLFNLVEIPKEIDNTSDSKKDELKTGKTDKSLVGDSVTSQIKKHIKNEKQNDDLSSEEMANILAERRRAKISK